MKNKITIFIILFILAIFCNAQNFDNNLCLSNEKVLISFQIINSNKILSVCISDSEPNYIVYRFGTKDKIELSFPESLKNSWDSFVYSYYLRSGGAQNEGLDLNYLKFRINEFEYEIYEEYSSQDNNTLIGIKIKDTNTKKEFELKGNISTLKGSLIDLRFNEKIKKGE